MQNVYTHYLRLLTETKKYVILIKNIPKGGEMAGVMLDALKKAGLLSPQQIAEREREEELKRFQEEEMNKGRFTKQANKVVLVVANPNDFREAAKNELLRDPSVIQEIIKQAHQFKTSKEGKKLVWQLYQLRDAIAKTPEAENQKTVVNRALRRINPVFEPIP